MSGRQYAADDAEAISDGLAKLRAERDAIFRCTCGVGIGDRGDTVRLPTAGCPIHSDNLSGVYMGIDLASGPDRTAVVVGSAVTIAPGVYRLTLDDLKRIEGFTFTAPSPERRAEILAGAERALAAGHFRLGR